jgi:hypothetical protein
MTAAIDACLTCEVKKKLARAAGIGEKTTDWKNFNNQRL